MCRLLLVAWGRERSSDGARGCDWVADLFVALAEHRLVDLLGGQVARSRVQAGRDAMTPEGTVQVRTLSNTSPDQWVNELTVLSVPGVDRYALGKRHGDQATTLQITRRDFVRLLSEQESAAAVGAQVWTPAELANRASP